MRGLWLPNSWPEFATICKNIYRIGNRATGYIVAATAPKLESRIGDDYDVTYGNPATSGKSYILPVVNRSS